MQVPKILIVDDDPAILLFLERVFSEAGWCVRTVRNGKRALAAVRRQSFDAILMDVMMPGDDGVSTVRALRARPLNCTSPIILMSAADDPTAQLNGFFAGVADFLPKPFTPRDVVTRTVRAVTASAMSL